MGKRTWLSVLLLVALMAPASAAARDFSITSFDGTSISAHFFPAGSDRAPTVLIGPGWGNPGWTSQEQGSDTPNAQIGVRPLRQAGYNVLTWDPRGFGSSGGEAKVDSPHFEARDVQKLIDALAGFPEAQLDSADDPRVGMAGASYGGGIQWVTAAIDSRLEAIVPNIAWHSLDESLSRDGLFKGGWGNFLCGVGVANGVFGGLINPGGIQGGSMDPHFYSMCNAGVTGGGVSETDRAWLRERGPLDEWMKRVKVPTLLLHSTVDTLFTPSQAAANFKVLRASGVPTRMMWFCGGHGACLTSAGPGGYVEAAVLRWLARYLKGDQAVDTGPRFEWLDQQGRWLSASDYPLTAAGQLSASGSGTLTLRTADLNTSGSTIGGAPASNGVNVDVPAPSGDLGLVGEPVLELEYAGSATGSGTHIFAQVVDLDRGIVLGGQVTPFPLLLDGAKHTISRRLEGLAYAVSPASRLQLQVIPSSNVYGQQRVTGAVTLSRISFTAPLGTSPPTPPACKPRFSPKSVRMDEERRAKLKPVVKCGKRRLALPVVVRAGLKLWTIRTGKKRTLRIPRGAKKLTARYSVDGRARKAKIKLK